MSDPIPAKPDPVLAREQRLQARLDEAHERIGALTYDVESRDKTIRKLRADLKTAHAQIRNLSILAEPNELLIAFRNECERHGVTGKIDSWRVIDTPQFQRIMCDLLTSIDEAGMIQTDEEAPGGRV